MNQDLKGRRVFVSWSGGKDCCLALWRAVRAGAHPAFILNMLREDGQRSRSHGLSARMIAVQAARMRVPLLWRTATWNGYEEAFRAALRELHAGGTADGVFGDIDLDVHRKWIERVCGECGITPHLPLWLGARRSLVEEFIDAGFEAHIVAVRLDRLSPSFLGRLLDRRTISDLEAAGVDAAGEAGEYHSVVTAGPLFGKRIPFQPVGRSEHAGVMFLDLKDPD